MGKAQYKPVPLDLRAELAQAVRRPGFKEAWDALEEEYGALSKSLKAKQSREIVAEAEAGHIGATQSARLMGD